MYTFRLQTVLDHYRFQEDRLQQALARIRKRAGKEAQQLSRLEQKAQATADRLRQAQTAGISSRQVVLYHAYLFRLSKEIEKQRRVVAEGQARESTARAELSAALKRRKSLEKLKDRGLRRHRRAIRKKEMGMIDEIAIHQFVQKRMKTA